MDFNFAIILFINFEPLCVKVLNDEPVFIYIIQRDDVNILQYSPSIQIDKICDRCQNELKLKSLNKKCIFSLY